jgi:WD40 repeat protein/beta-lactamase regulating signal transducer with metallopeptidase domain
MHAQWLAPFDTLPWAVSIVARATLLLLLACLGSALAGRRSAALRHRLWSLTFVSLLPLPLLALCLPPVPLRVISARQSVSPPRSTAQAVDMKAQPRVVAATEAIPRENAEFSAPEPFASKTTARSQESPRPGPEVIASARNVSFATLLLGLWGVGAAAGLLALAVDLARGIKASQGATDITDAEWLRLWQQALTQLEIRHAVGLCRSACALPPLVCGVLRPSVLLPAAADAWTSAVRRSVLLHELAHVKRRDVLWQLLARVACALYWFHPLAWFGLYRLRIERELASDDCVLASGIASTDYAQHLVQVARRLQGPRWRAAVAMAAPGGLEARVKSLLDARRSHLPLDRREAFVVAFATLALVTTASVLRPALRAATPPPAEVAVATADNDGKAPAGRVDQYGDPLPEGAVSRIGTLRFRQPDDITDLEFTADGRFIVAVAEAGEVSFFERDSGKLLERLLPVEGGRHHAQRIDLLDDGTLAVLGSYRPDDDQLDVGSVRLIDPQTRRQSAQQLLKAPREQLLAISPDGAALACTKEMVLRMLDRTSGGELVRREIKEEITKAEFSPDGLQLAFGTSAGAYRWTWNSSEPPRKVTATREVTSLAFSADNAQLAVATDDHPGHGVRIFEGEAASRELPMIEGQEYARGLKFLDQGRRLAVASDPTKAVVLWDLDSMTEVRRLGMTPGDAGALAGTRDGRWLAAGSFWRSVIRAWNADTGAELGPGEAAPLAYALQLEFSADGKTLFTGGEDNTVRAWIAETGQQRYRADHGHWVRAIALSPDGRLLAESSLDDTVCLREAETGKELYRLPGHGRLGGRRALRFSADGSRLFSFGDDMYVRTWDVSTGRAIAETLVRPSGVEIPADPADDTSPGFDSWRFGVDQAAFLPEGERLLLLYQGQARLIEVATGRELSAFGYSSALPVGLSVSPDARWFATSSWGRPVEILLPDGGIRSSAARHHSIRVRSMATGEDLWSLDLPEGGAGPVAFSSDGSKLATASGETGHRIQLWDAASGRELARIPIPGQTPRSLALSRDGSRVAVGLNDTTVVIWDFAPILIPQP